MVRTLNQSPRRRDNLLRLLSWSFGLEVPPPALESPTEAPNLAAASARARLVTPLAAVAAHAPI
jgi:hypothetical protein